MVSNSSPAVVPSIPTFTVVIPLYNTERYIACTLRSVLDQTFEDFEVVVVDDQSSDRGPEIVRSMMAADARIRMVTQENRGLAGSRNTGIRHARGRYIALLDADDLWLPQKLAAHHAQLEADPLIGVAYSASRLIDEHGNLLGLYQRPRLSDIDAEHILCRNPVGNGSAGVIRRKALDAVAFDIEAPEGLRTCWFDETFRQSEDIEMWSRMAATTEWSFAGLAEPLTLYRIHTGALSANTSRQLETWYRFRSKLAMIAPSLVDRAGARAEAYQLRYLGRRCAMNGDGIEACRLVLRSLRLHPRVIVEEPSRTLQSLAFAATAALLPACVFAPLKNLLMGPSAPSPAGA